MATESALPRRGTRISTAEGDWEVKEVVLLGREPLHYAVRMTCPVSTGGQLTVVLSRAEYEGLCARSKAAAGSAGRTSRPGKLGPR